MSYKLISFLVFAGCISYGSAMECKKEGLFGITTYISCPQIGQPSDYNFCCGSEENRYCCQFPLELDQETVDKIVENLPRLIGILVGVVLVVLLVCVVCCCCCPFCLLAKRRNRGHVTRGGAEVTVTLPPQQAAQPLQPYSQPQPYVQPQQPYPQQPYPQQPYPQQPYPPQQYPNTPAAGYPDQPPPYAEKQPAFNPNYNNA